MCYQSKNWTGQYLCFRENKCKICKSKLDEQAKKIMFKITNNKKIYGSWETFPTEQEYNSNCVLYKTSSYYGEEYC